MKTVILLLFLCANAGYSQIIGSCTSDTKIDSLKCPDCIMEINVVGDTLLITEDSFTGGDIILNHVFQISELDSEIIEGQVWHTFEIKDLDTKLKAIKIKDANPSECVYVYYTGNVCRFVGNSYYIISK